MLSGSGGPGSGRGQKDSTSRGKRGRGRGLDTTGSRGRGQSAGQNPNVSSNPKDPGGGRSGEAGGKELLKDSLRWDPTGGPTSTSFGKTPGSSSATITGAVGRKLKWVWRGKGRGKGKGKGKAAGEGDGDLEVVPEIWLLDPAGAGLEGDIIAAVPTESEITMPIGIPEPPSPAQSFISDKPAAPPRTASEESVISYRSETNFDARGQRQYHLKNPNPEARRKLFEYIDSSFDRPRMLMLTAGQGGTFRFGEGYITESDKEITGVPALKKDSSITKHLEFFGRNVQLVGTVKCVSCTGVYFEIDGNRFFCAHINTWHQDTFDCAYLKKGDTEYEVIVQAVLKRLKTHAKEYGWTRDEVNKETLVVICPEPDAQDYAVPEAALALQIGGPIGQGLHVTWGVRPTDGKHGYVRDALPQGIERVYYKHSNKDWVVQQWCYTADYKWHHIDPDFDSRFGRRLDVDLGSTVQEFAPDGMMFQGVEKVQTTIERQRDYVRRNARGDTFYYTNQYGKPIAVERPWFKGKPDT